MSMPPFYFCAHKQCGFTEEDIFIFKLICFCFVFLKLCPQSYIRIQNFHYSFINSVMHFFYVADGNVLFLGTIKLAASFSKIHRHRAMKWDLFEEIAKKEGCFLSLAKLTSVENLDNEFSPTGFPLSVLWTLWPNDTVLNRAGYSTAATLSLLLNPQWVQTVLSVDKNSCVGNLNKS